MSAIREDQLKNASAFMNDIWKNLIKPYYNPEEPDEWWNELINRISDIGHKYCEKDRRLLRILLGFENGLSEVWKEEGNGRQAQ